ncbi:MAG: nitrous oxide reductase family maturation protein NosD [Myxococcales bacterium]|nr:nitrous oxide reductase family maturation protein NosD [Myxococcales bacterium]
MSDRASLLVLALASCGEARGMTDAGLEPGRPPRPDACVEIEPGASIQAALDDPGTHAVCLAPGDHRGPVRLTRSVTLWGAPGSTLHGGLGTIVDVTAPHGAVLGLTIDGTGGRFDMLDAAVRLTADDTRVEGVTVTNAVFGILVERASRVRLVGNRIEGSRDPATGMRGDTMRLWETRDSVVADNTIEDGRDVVIWYSSGNTITNNRVHGARYSLHFMYSHDNSVRGNELVSGTVGVFVMYSHNLHLTDNLIANAAGAAGMAIGIKDAGNIYITGNRLIHDTIGIYIDSSPMQRGDRVEIEGNVLRLDDTGIVFHSSAHDLSVRDNDFADNGTQVRVDGGGDATAVAWTGNYFDDYTGYDLDDDGIGDVPYELRSLSNQLTGQNPSLALFHGTPALALVDAAAHLDPLYQPAAVLADQAPRVEPRWTVEHATRSPR